MTDSASQTLDDGQLCSSVVTCRDPDPFDPCYENHECELPAFHMGAHRGGRHGSEWTDGYLVWDEKARDYRSRAPRRSAPDHPRYADD